MIRFCALLVFLSLVLVSGTARAALELSGRMVQGGLVHGQVPPGTRVCFGEREVSVSATGEFILGFGRDAQPEQKLVLVDSTGQRSTRELRVEQRRYKIERIDGINRRMMEPSPEELQRISAEAGLVAEARQSDSLLEYFREDFIWPLQGRISGVYGSQRILNGEPRRPHYGLDIAAPKGSTVVAPAGGVVSLSHLGMFYSGATLIIDHGHGLSSSFLHLSEILVQPGQRVTQGQPIARVGASGRVTGPHLDWRVNWFDTRLDPRLLVP